MAHITIGLRQRDGVVVVRAFNPATETERELALARGQLRALLPSELHGEESELEQLHWISHKYVRPRHAAPVLCVAVCVCVCVFGYVYVCVFGCACVWLWLCLFCCVCFAVCMCVCVCGCVCVAVAVWLWLCGCGCVWTHHPAAHQLALHPQGQWPGRAEACAAGVAEVRQRGVRHGD